MGSSEAPLSPWDVGVAPFLCRTRRGGACTAALSLLLESQLTLAGPRRVLEAEHRCVRGSRLEAEDALRVKVVK